MLSVLSPAYSIQAQEPKGNDVLVIDFIGFKDSGSIHAKDFLNHFYPRASLVSVGFEGIRVTERYDILVGNNKSVNESAAKIVGLIGGNNQAVISFDFAEAVPQQLRGSQNQSVLIHSLPIVGNPIASYLAVAPDKISGPANVAAQVAITWRESHPFGHVILLGHSDGTWAALYIHDALVQHGMPPSAVIPQSPRQEYRAWADRSISNPATIYIPITAVGDFSGQTPIGNTYSRLPSSTSSNWHNVEVRERMNILDVHSSVRDYDKSLHISINGIPQNNITSIGALIQKEITNLPASYPPSTIDRGGRAIIGTGSHVIMPNSHQSYGSAENRIVVSPSNSSSGGTPVKPDVGGIWLGNPGRYEEDPSLDVDDESLIDLMSK